MAFKLPKGWECVICHQPTNSVTCGQQCLVEYERQLLVLVAKTFPATKKSGKPSSYQQLDAIRPKSWNRYGQ